MIDLSEEPLEENIAICKKYLGRMSKMGMTLEIELGITGGEEDGVDNSDVDVSKLYTQPEEVAYAYEELSKSFSSIYNCSGFWKRTRCLQTRKRKINSKNFKEFSKIYQKKYGVIKNQLILYFMEVLDLQ